MATSDKDESGQPQKCIRYARQGRVRNVVNLQSVKPIRSVRIVVAQLTLTGGSKALMFYRASPLTMRMNRNENSKTGCYF